MKLGTRCDHIIGHKSWKFKKKFTRLDNFAMFCDERWYMFKSNSKLFPHPDLLELKIFCDFIWKKITIYSNLDNSQKI